MQDPNLWVKILGGLITFIGALFTFLVARGKAVAEKEAQFRRDILEELNTNRKEKAALWEKVESQSGRIRELESELEIQKHEWQLRLELFESAHQDLPLPMWLKDKDGKMLALNPRYEQVFLIPRGFCKKDYVNAYDSDIWPSDIAEAFGRHDKHVYETGKTWIGYEFVPDKEDNLIRWKIIKYIRYAQGVRLGIAGIAIPLDGEEDG